jgi:probable phosphoglycerate mutase
VKYHQRPFALPEGATHVVLVRHGASAPAVAGESFPMRDGHGDPELTEVGQAQAQAAAEALAGEDPAAIFVTPLRRTVQTAAPLAERLEMEAVVVPELREVHLGDWEGGEFRIRAANGDPLIMEVMKEQNWELVPGAESMEGFADRVAAGLRAVVEASGPNATAVVFTHGGVISELCRQATGSRPLAFLGADNASFTRLFALAEDHRLVRSFNETAHLAAVPAQS